MNETRLAKSSVSCMNQTHIPTEVRPFLKVKKGDKLEWFLINGEIIVRKLKVKT